MEDTAPITVASQKWDTVWNALNETGRLSLDDFEMNERQKESIRIALDELETLGFVESNSDQTWTRAF